jgi:hypothetical protein
MALKIPYVLYDFITTLCRQQADVTQNHKNKKTFAILGMANMNTKYTRLKLGCGHDQNCSMTELPLQQDLNEKTVYCIQPGLFIQCTGDMK